MYTTSVSVPFSHIISLDKEIFFSNAYYKLAEHTNISIEFLLRFCNTVCPLFHIMYTELRLYSISSSDFEALRTTTHTQKYWQGMLLASRKSGNIFLVEATQKGWLAFETAFEDYSSLSLFAHYGTYSNSTYINRVVL